MSNASRVVAALGACVCLACGGDDGAAPADTTGVDESTGASMDGTSAAMPGESSGDDAAADETAGSDVCDGLEFDNAVDEAACPYVQGKGVEPVAASETELCRRTWIDLAGRVPLPDEVATSCAGVPQREIVDALMADDRYVQLVRRNWADALRMNSMITYYEYIEAADARVQALARGEILLPELAVDLATSPAFVGRFDGQDLVGYNFQMFLGRDAAPHERQGLLGLWRTWTHGYVEMHPDYYFPYETVIVDTTLCTYLPALCHSELWGHHSVIVPMPDPTGEYEDNLIELDDLDDATWDLLRTPGVLITEQPTFYEAAADDALERYLGYDAGVQMPLVQQALVTMLVESGGDILAVEREILTSDLYGMAAAAPDADGTPADEGTPDAWHGPMKQMSAEAWLDSVARLTSIPLGSCDPRYPDVNLGLPYDGAPEELYRWHPNEYPKDPYFPAEANAPDYGYRGLAQRLGGCPDQFSQLRFTGTGVMISLAHAQLLQALCEFMPADAPLVPADLDFGAEDADTLASVATHMIDVVTLGEPLELDTMIDDAVNGCMDDDDCTAALFSQQTCEAVLQSGTFLFY